VNPCRQLIVWNPPDSVVKAVVSPESTEDNTGTSIEIDANTNNRY